MTGVREQLKWKTLRHRADLVRSKCKHRIRYQSSFPPFCPVYFQVVIRHVLDITVIIPPPRLDQVLKYEPLPFSHLPILISWFLSCRSSHVSKYLGDSPIHWFGLTSLMTRQCFHKSTLNLPHINYTPSSSLEFPSSFCSLFPVSLTFVSSRSVIPARCSAQAAQPQNGRPNKPYHSPPKPISP